ncbi:MAG TPA: DNA repair exonuclease [Clostridiales bacterium]|nr:DNA repair exonuclease [Clostridiales bacterium]
MKIIHCSDIHLDSRLECVNSKERNNELLNTFNKMVDYAAANDVRAIIIAGDLFDTQSPTSKTKKFLSDLISQTPKIDFLYLKGNHDGYDIFDAVDMPPNFKPFLDKWTTYNYDDVTIAGIQITNDNYKSLYQQLDLTADQKNIVVMHGQISASTKPDTVNLELLKNKNIDYLALGHYHSFSWDKLDKRGIYCYSGCLEGRGYDEVGEKGFVLLDAQNLSASPLLITNLSHRTVYEIDADISEKNSYLEIKNAITQAVSGIDSRHYVKVNLTGSYILGAQKDLHHIKLDFEPLFYSFKVQDNTQLQIDIEDYQYDISLKGEFIRSVLKSNLPQKQKEDIINFGIRALKGEDIML